MHLDTLLLATGLDGYFHDLMFPLLTYLCSSLGLCRVAIISKAGILYAPTAAGDWIE